MGDGLNLFSGRGKYLLGSLIVLFIAAICAAFSMTGKDDFTISRREILLRRIGDQLLLQSGDSTSRVLPVKKISENEYQIRFENDLTFQSDSLVNITRSLLAEDPLTHDYVVNVLYSGSSGIAYGYAISKNKKNDIVACSGRKQPRAHYVIDIKFKPSGTNLVRNGYVLGGLPLLAFIGFIFLRFARQPRVSNNDQLNVKINLGSALFNVRERQLIINKQIIDLTVTETRLMVILAAAPNQTIERSRLQKEIWEDEGVIVGRSLDMFISKLRKKLEPDPDINIVVVRGKGYKLEIGC